MRHEETMARWQQLATTIGEGVRRLLNTPAMIGTKDETGYLLMIFNADHHEGRSTVVCTETDPDKLRKLLQTVLDNMDKAKFIAPEAKQ
jgi:hypothetical protein